MQSGFRIASFECCVFVLAVALQTRETKLWSGSQHSALLNGMSIVAGTVSTLTQGVCFDESILLPSGKG